MTRFKSMLGHSSFLFSLMFACAPVEMSKESLIGEWQVDWNCGVEKLELKADGTYVQDIEYRDGGHASHTGHSWKITPKESRLDPGHVVLEDAVQFCSVFGEKLEKLDSRQFGNGSFHFWNSIPTGRDLHVENEILPPKHVLQPTCAWRSILMARTTERDFRFLFTSQRRINYAP